MRFAKRMSTQPAQAFSNYEKAIELERSGVDIIKMGVGSPSFDTPANIKEATKRALDLGFVHYDEMAGLKEFRYALEEKLAKVNGIKADPDTQILVTSGLTLGAYAAIMALIDEGDELVNFDPGYTTHDKRVAFAGGKVAYASLKKSEHYLLNKHELEKAINPRTRAILWVDPHNPLGRVFSRSEIEIVAEVAKEHDLVVLSDETYEYFTYDGRKHISIASLPGMAERTVSLFTFTKAYAMDGWRLGYATGPEVIINEMKKVTTAAHTHVNTFIQKGDCRSGQG